MWVIRFLMILLLPLDQAIPTIPKYPEEKNPPIYSCGHGLGLPLLLHFDSHVIYRGDFFFNVCLDFFGGNSGSPIFDARTHRLIGILAGSIPDFEVVGQACRGGRWSLLTALEVCICCLLGCVFTVLSSLTV